MATLIVLGLPAPGKRYTVQKNRQAIIGRDPTCDLVIPRQSISRFHAQVIPHNGGYFLEDLGSTNGTLINGRKIQKRERLSDGDRISLHEVPIGFYLSDVIPDAEEDRTRFLPSVEMGEQKSTSHEFAIPTTPAGVRTLKGRLDSLIEITRDLGSSLDLNEILPRALDLLFRMFGQATFGEIHLVEADGEVRPVAMKHGRDADSTDLTGAPVNAQLIHEVLKTGQGVVQHEEAGDPALALDEFHLCTVCAPILGPESVPCGVILLQSEGSTYGFNDDDLELISAVAVVAGQSIGYSRAHQMMVAHNNTRRQMETARQVQLGMLPRERPQVPGYEFCHHYAAAERVGGDYFFYEMLRDGRVIFGIADASGKGLSAAMHIVRFAGEVRFRIATSPTLKSAVSSLNKFILNGAEECMFITACFCVLDPKQNLLTLANVGHPPPMLRRRGSTTVEQLMTAKRTFPLGITEALEVHPITLEVTAGDQVIFFTDGVSEAMNLQNDLFGIERLTQSILNSTGSISQTVASLVEDVDLFRDDRAPSDDMTIVGFEYVGHVPA